MMLLTEGLRRRGERKAVGGRVGVGGVLSQVEAPGLTMMPAVQGLRRSTAHTRKVQASTTLMASRNQCRRPMYCSQKRKGYPLG